MKDPAYLAAMKKARLIVDPTPADELSRIVSEIINAPPSVIAKARAALSSKGLVKCSEHTDAKYCAAEKKKKKG
jgi:hypothetical protein